MYKVCKIEKSIERQKLFQTTLLSMMKKTKFQEITVTSLCKQMEIPRKTFYRYFDSLEDVLYMTMDEALTEGFLFLEVQTDVVGFFRYWKKKKSLLDVLEKNGLSYMLTTRSHEQLEENIKNGQLTNRDLRYAGYISAIMTILLMWHHSGMKQTEEEISQQLKEMFNISD
ncbi:MAG: TetR/AcrR family transcriptional regulator [Agathobacter sp.]|nr:TetR/AcrR family transcriptional regulator [Agathobacter sp.]